MIRIRAVLVGLVVVLSVISVVDNCVDRAAAEALYVQNYGFEDTSTPLQFSNQPQSGYHDIPPGWQVSHRAYVNADGYYYPYSNIESLGGSQVLYVDTPYVSSSSYSELGISSSSVSFPSDAVNIILSFNWYKLSGGSSNTVNLYVHEAGGSGIYLDQTITAAADGGWHYVTMTVSSTIAGRGAYFVVTVRGTGTSNPFIYFDNFIFTYNRGPVITISPGILDFGSVDQGYVGSRSFEIWNSGGSTLTYSLSESCSWITSVSPSSGSSTGEHDTIVVTINTSGLSIGSTYQDRVSITSNGGNQEVLVRVSVATPVLAFGPTTLDFGTVEVGFTGSMVFQIWNSGQGTLTYTVSESTNWISYVSPSSGSSTGEYDVVTVGIDTSGLSPGNAYAAGVGITSNGGSGTLSVHVVVTSPPAGLSLSITWKYEGQSPMNSKPCQGARVELWKPNIIGTHDVIATDHTNGDGHVTFSPLERGEYAVCIWADDDLILRVQEDLVYTTYSWWTGWMTIDESIDQTTWINDDRRGIWEFYQAIRDTYFWMLEETSFSRSHVTVYWPTQNPFFHPTQWMKLDKIYVDEADIWNRADAIGEYAHALHYASRDYQWPWWEIPSEHYLFTESDAFFALAEGWSWFLQSAVQGVDTLGLECQNTEGFADILDGGWDGNLVEGSAAQIFWDIFDGASEADYTSWDGAMYGDHISDRLPDLWNIMKNRAPNSTDEIWTSWMPKDADIWAIFYHARTNNDVSLPSNPSSYTGPPTGTWSKDITIDVSVDGASDDLSGIWCYDYLWSYSPQDPTDMSRTYSSNIPTYHPSSGYWYLNVRAIDRAGNYAPGYYWNPEPWWIDVNPPTNPSSFMSSHQINVPSSNNDIWIQWIGASDSPSGLAGFSILWDNSPYSIPDETIETTDTTSASGAVADGAWYFHLRTRDVAGNWAFNVYCVGPFIVGPPSNVPPVAVIVADSSGMVNEALHFDASGSYDPDGTIVSYNWEFGDGSTDSGPVVEHSWSTEGTYTVTLTVIDNGGLFDQESVSVTINLAPPLDPGALSSIRIDDGTGSFEGISSSNKQLVVNPGTALVGDLTMTAINGWVPIAAVTMMGTTSWGNHSQSYWTVGSIAVGANSYTSHVDVIAPSEPGVYYLIFAMRGEFSGAQVASATNWFYGAPVWDDGNDIAIFSASQITEAQANGRTNGIWLLSEGYTVLPIPADAITVVVPDLSPRLDIHVSTDKVVYATGEPVNISISLTNNGLGTAVLTFPSTMQAYYTVADSLGYPVYDYRLHGVGMPVMTELVLPPEQTVYYNYTWDQVNDGGTQVPSLQWYTIKGFVSATEVNLQSATSIMIAPASEQFTLVLKAGWNLVSVPLLNDSIKASTLGLQTGDIVATWDPVAQDYGQTYVIGVSSPAYDFSIEQGVSYIVWVAVETQIVVKGISPSVLSSYRMPLTLGSIGGWACIGIVSLSSTMHASDLASCVSGAKVLFVSKWNTTSGLYEDYVVGISPSSYDFEIEPGEGYWMWIDQSGVLEYTP